MLRSFAAWCQTRRIPHASRVRRAETRWYGRDKIMNKIFSAYILAPPMNIIALSSFGSLTRHSWGGVALEIQPGISVESDRQCEISDPSCSRKC